MVGRLSLSQEMLVRYQQEEPIFNKGNNMFSLRSIPNDPRYKEKFTELMWISSDRGAFGNVHDGPFHEWIDNSHDFMNFVDNFETVVQAGGNCGMYAKFYGNYFQNVISIEPDKNNFYCLKYNCSEPKFTLYNNALGESKRKVSLNNNNLTNVGMHTINETPGNVEMITIDSLNLTSCNLIHLDVESYEPEALIGAKTTIEKYHPVIITEAGSGNNVLTKYGYSVKQRLIADVIFLYGRTT